MSVSPSSPSPAGGRGGEGGKRGTDLDHPHPDPLPPAGEGVESGIAGRLIVALDVATVAAAQALVERLGATVWFYKIGYWLLYQPGADALIDRLLAGGKQLFFDAKLYDIGETVRRGVQAIARRGASIVTVHGEPDMLRAAVEARGNSKLKIFAVTVLTSQDEAATRALGYDRTLQEIIDLRVRHAVEAGCDGIIASAADDPAALRARAGAPGLLVATPGIRLPGGAAHDQRRVATPDAAIARGADYLVVGRPVTEAADPAEAAAQVIALMRQGWARRSPTLRA